MRLGSIEFINSLPVDLGILNGTVALGAQVVSGTPAALNEQILKKELEASPVSAFFYAQNQREFLILPDLSISSESGVDSVLLFSRYPLRELAGKKITVTEKGRTTPVLLEVLCRLKYGFSPLFESFRAKREISSQGDFSSACGGLEMTKDCDAFLLIGDEALKAKEQLKSDGLQVIDLAEEWRAWTGLPIVFALWVVRRDYFLAHPEEIFQLHQAILISKRWGFGHMDQVLARSREKTGLGLDILKSYFSRLSYGFDENLQKGLRLYFDYACRCQLMDLPVDLEFMPDVVRVNVGLENAAEY